VLNPSQLLKFEKKERKPHKPNNNNKTIEKRNKQLYMAFVKKFMKALYD